ncbi:MAG: DUF4062 domain-containing protein [Methanosarcinaceae archaeon]|nr:DUF4062 domain-containing protein [Methanosarcinaceae archaeon]
MAKKWRTIRLFISSTFRDMHAERDHLVRFVFPELKEKCRKRRVNLIDVDLRWGVTEADAQDGKALDICLDEIDSCRPYFLGLLGHRYGWVPRGQEHSITAQEIYHGVLHNDVPSQVMDLRRIIEGRIEGKALTDEQVGCLVRCYQWDAEKGKHLLSHNVSEDDLKVIGSVFKNYSTYQRDRSFFFFRSEALTRKLARHNIEDFLESEEMDKEKLAALKQEITDSGLPCFEYDNIEAFDNQVRDILWKRIEVELGETVEIEKDWLEEEAEFHELFVTDRTRRFVGRRNLLDSMRAFCENDGESSVMVITGEPGCGKSALMGRFTEEILHNHPDWSIIPHFVGASPTSTNLRQTLRRFCAYLNRIVGSTEEVPEDIKELLKIFPDMLAKAAENLRILFILDAANQLEKTDNAHDMRWIPHELPENVTFVVSTLAGEAHDAILSRRNKPLVEKVVGLDDVEIKELVNDYLKEIRHEFPNKEVEKTFYEKVKAGNPLYIQVALEELRIFGKFEELADRINNLPENVSKLFNQVLERIESDFNKPLVCDCMSLIACGKHGMTAEELQTLLRAYAPRIDSKTESEKLPDMLWARLHRAFRSYLFERSGVIDFFHGQLKEAVGEHYLCKEAARIASHRTIANYFENRWKEPYQRALEELPYQQVHSRNLSKLRITLTDFDFIYAKVIAIGVHQMIEDYDLVLQSELISSSGVLKSDGRAFKLIQATLRLSAHVIVKDKTQLASQLMGRMLSFEGIEIQKMLKQVRQWKEAPWICPLTSSLIMAGGALTRTMEGKYGPIVAVALTPDGRRAVSSSGEVLSVWDIESGVEQFTFKSNEGILSVAVTSDGCRALSGHMDKTIKVWDIETGVEIDTLKGHSDWVNSVAVTPDGRLAVSGSGDKTIMVWDIEKRGEKSANIALKRLFALLPFLKYRKKPVHILKGHSRRVQAVAVTPDGRLAVSGSFDKTLKVWDLEAGVELHTLKGHSDWVQAVAVTPDGRLAVSGSVDKTLKVWNIEAGAEVHTLAGHKYQIGAVAITSNGRWAISSTEIKQGILKTWDIERGSEYRTIQTGLDYGTRALAITPDGRWALTGSDDWALKVWDLTSPDVSQVQKPHKSMVLAVAVTPDGRWAASISQDKTLKVWDLKTGTELQTVTNDKYMTQKMALMPDGCRAVSGSDDMTLKVIDLKTGIDLLNLKNYELQTVKDYFSGEISQIQIAKPIFAVGVTPDGRWAISGSDDIKLKVWNLENGANHQTVKNARIQWPPYMDTLNGQRIYAKPFSQKKPFNPLFSPFELARTDLQILKVVDIETGVDLHLLRGHTDIVTSVAVTPDGRRGVSASKDKTLILWDLVGNGEVIGNFTGDSSLFACAIAPDGNTIIAGELSGRVHFLRVKGIL